jgi:hypothetical protein
LLGAVDSAPMLVVISRRSEGVPGLVDFVEEIGPLSFYGGDHGNVYITLMGREMRDGIEWKGMEYYF